jgi:hypothetical protein
VVLSSVEDPGRPFWNRWNPPPPVPASLVGSVFVLPVPSAAINRVRVRVRRLKPKPLLGRIFGLQVAVGSLAFDPPKDGSRCFRFRAVVIIVSEIQKGNGKKMVKKATPPNQDREGGGRVDNAI